MKKNLNIAYLNGAEGMIRRGGASSGGSGESGGEASTIEYLDVSGMDVLTSALVKCVSIYAKGEVEGQYIIMPTSFWYYNKSDLGFDMPQYISFVAIDSNASVTGGDNFTKTTIKEYMVYQGVDIDAIPRLTKEQFYSLE